MIDTLAYAKHLEDNGVDRRAAEAHAQGLLRFIMPDIATKADLDALALKLVLANLTITGFALALAKFLF
jgi:hypothetical protein